MAFRNYVTVPAICLEQWAYFGNYGEIYYDKMSNHLMTARKKRSVCTVYIKFELMKIDSYYFSVGMFVQKVGIGLYSDDS